MRPIRVYILTVDTGRVNGILQDPHPNGDPDRAKPNENLTTAHGALAEPSQTTLEIKVQSDPSIQTLVTQKSHCRRQDCGLGPYNKICPDDSKIAGLVPTTKHQSQKDQSAGSAWK